MLEERPLTAAVMRTFRTKGEVNPRMSFTAHLPGAIVVIHTLYDATSLMANQIVIIRSLINALGIMKELLRTEAADPVFFNAGRHPTAIFLARAACCALGSFL